MSGERAYGLGKYSSRGLSVLSLHRFARSAPRYPGVFRPGKAAVFQLQVAVPQSGFVDGQTLILHPTATTDITFEFDVAGNGVAGGNVQVDISGDVTAIDVMQTLIAAIEGATTDYDVVVVNATTMLLVNALNDEIGFNLAGPNDLPSGTATSGGDVTVTQLPDTGKDFVPGWLMVPGKRGWVPALHYPASLKPA